MQYSLCPLCVARNLHLNMQTLLLLLLLLALATLLPHNGCQTVSRISFKRLHTLVGVCVRVWVLATRPTSARDSRLSLGYSLHTPPPPYLTALRQRFMHCNFPLYYSLNLRFHKFFWQQMAKQCACAQWLLSSQSSQWAAA